ncbi:reverse transcriptase domain-containing protein [Tanacetum coccineum]
MTPKGPGPLSDQRSIASTQGDAAISEITHLLHSNLIFTFTPSGSRLILTFTPELGLGSQPEARLTRLSFLFSGTQLNTPQNLGSPHFSLEVREITSTNWRHPWDPNLIYHSSKMSGPSEGGGPGVQDDREATPPPLTKEQIEGHLSALRSIIKEHNRKNKTYPIQLDFDEEDIAAKDTRIVKGNEVVDDDLRKPFKEALKTPLTRRIIEFAGPEYMMPTNIKLYDGTTDPEDHLGRFASAANSGEWPMPVWCRMFQQTLDGPARGWFERLPANSIDEWADMREAFATRYSVRRACFKEPHEITKIVRRANESLTAFKERWTVETGFIMGVPEVMKISSFMDSLKCLELAKCFSDKDPTTVNEMMKRLDDFVCSERAFTQTKLPKGETGEQHRKSYFPSTRRDDRPLRNNNHVTDQRRYDPLSNYKGRDNIVLYRGRDNRPPYPPPRGDYQA